MSRLPSIGPRGGVRLATLPTPRIGPPLGAGLAVGGRALGEAATALGQSLRRARRFRRFAEIEVEINDAAGASLAAAELGESDQAAAIVEQHLAPVRQKIEQEEDSFVRDRATALLDLQRSRTINRANRSAAQRERLAWKAANEARKAQDLRGVSAGILMPSAARAENLRRNREVQGDLLSPEEVRADDALFGEAVLAAQARGAVADVRVLERQLLDTYEQQIDTAGRSAVRADFIQLLDMQEKAGLITAAEAAARTISFDANATARIKALAIELAQQGQAVAAIGDPAGDLDRLQTRLAGLPKDVEEVKTSKQRFRVFEKTARAASDGAVTLAKMFKDRRLMDPRTAPTGNARERFYQQAREAGTDLATLTDFFVDLKGELPPGLLSDARGLLKPDSGTFDVEVGIGLLEVAARAGGAPAAARLAPETIIGDMAMRIGIGSQGSLRADLVRLLSDPNTERFLGEIQPFFDPRNQKDLEDSVKLTKFTKYVDRVDKRPGNPQLNSDQLDEMASFMRLEFLRRRIDQGDGDEKGEVFKSTQDPAATQFIGSRHSMRVSGQRVYYRNVLSPGQGMIELARKSMEPFTQFIPTSTQLRSPFSGFDAVARPDLSMLFGPQQKVLLPVMGDSGIEAIGIGTLEPDETGAVVLKAELVRLGGANFVALRQMVQERNSRKRLHPLDYLSHHSSFGADTVQQFDREQDNPRDRYGPVFWEVAQATLSKRGILDGLPPSRQKALILEEADKLAREVGWGSYVEAVARGPG